MSYLGKTYLHLIVFGSLLFILGKIGEGKSPQFKHIVGAGMTLGLAIAAAGCVLGFFFCQEEEKSLLASASKPPEPNSKRALSECQTRKLGLLYALLGLAAMSFSPLLSPDFRSILAPAGAFCGLMGISFIITSMFYSRKTET